ncbi:MAG: formimidoylglutamate deiminase [Pseudomonadota bacterium]
MKIEAKSYLAEQAWINGGWAKNVVLTVSGDGIWQGVQPNATDEEQAGASRLGGPVLPGVVNAHSHAFQRAIVGLTERRSSTGDASDDFWSWRDRMYSAANRVTPDQLEAIASQLYAELLAGGYTQVCEFQYLHNNIDGAPYASPSDMSLALVRAAQNTGIGLTLLPTLYMRSGFTASGLRDDQRRFASTPDSVMRVVQDIQRQTAGDRRINCGIAIHSLRAAGPAALLELASSAQAASLPIHIHIAEQTQEVADCLAHTGQRPIEWLLNHASVDASWNLVHATHTTAAELQGVRASGAAIVICPATEANLGDGIFDLPGYAAVGGRWSIGSDSHVTRSWPEELRLLEYSQRLSLRQRNIAARVGNNKSSADMLFEAACAGGPGARGQFDSKNTGQIAVGQRADFVTLDMNSPALLGMPADYLLDALVFSSPGANFAEVFTAGQQVLAAGQLTGTTSGTGQETGLSPAVARRFTDAMQQLWR